MKKIVITGLLVLALAGCAAEGTEVEGAATNAPTAEATAETEAPETDPEPTQDPATEPCGELTAEEALEHAIPLLPPPFPPEQEYMADHDWTTQGADLAGYDPCAPLSWITLSVAGATGSSPSQVALFHNGEFVQAATEKSYGFWPRVTRVNPRQIDVVYIWPEEGQGNAEASGESPMTFTWTDDGIAVEGEPPSYL